MGRAEPEGAWGRSSVFGGEGAGAREVPVPGFRYNGASTFDEKRMCVCVRVRARVCVGVGGTRVLVLAV